MIQPICQISTSNTQWQHATTNGFSATETILPAENRNYCIFNEDKVNFFASRKESALPYLAQVLKTSSNEKEIVETLCIIDRMADNGTKGIDKMYPVLSKFNDTDSPNIQTYLAGIYRKTQVPDAFGPLVSMLINNSIKNSEQMAEQTAEKTTPKLFDPNEEIGGAILEYIKNWSQNSNVKTDGACLNCIA